MYITKFQVEHWDQNSNVKVCRPEKTPFQTRTDISAQLPKSPGNFENKTCFDTHPTNDIFDFEIFQNKIRTPCVKKQGLSNAQFRIEIASELCIR